VDGGALFPIAGPFTKEPIFGFPPQKEKRYSNLLAE